MSFGNWHITLLAIEAAWIVDAWHTLAIKPIDQSIDLAA